MVYCNSAEDDDVGLSVLLVLQLHMNTRFLVDEEHRRFAIEVVCDDRREYHVRLKRKGYYVGHARCPYLGRDTWTEGDLFITDGSVDTLELLARDSSNLIIDANDPCRFSLSQSAQKQKGIDYRHHGLGSELLKFVIEQARNLGIRHIYGSIVQRDIDQTPNLLEWYQRHGFVLCQDSPRGLANAVAHVHLDLR